MPQLQPLIYVLHSGNLYGTEQMALATLQGLSSAWRPALFAPPGPVHAEAVRRGLSVDVFRSVRELAQKTLPLLWQAQAPALVATGVSHSLLIHSMAKLMGRSLVHLHVVHGGTDEKLSYGRKPLLGGLNLRLVAVSAFVRDRLVAHGCRPEQIDIIENFTTGTTLAHRAAFGPEGVKRVAVLSRTDPIKRVNLVLDAMDRGEDLSGFHFDVYGAGSDLDALRQRATRWPNVALHGYVPDAAQRLAQHDVLLHTCAEEPFGLALLEAMAARVPILAPNRGGAGSLVTDGQTGFHFPANDARSMAQALRRVAATPAAQLNAVVEQAHQALQHRFSPSRGLAEYAALLEARP
jgi:glycosyltransferase involved in cell wall biosynthesis